MNILYVVLLSVGLALYLFRTVARAGATQAPISNRKLIGSGFLYSFVQMLLVSIGIIISYMIERILPIDEVCKIARGIVIALLLIIVYRLLKEAFSGKVFLEKRAKGITNKGCILLALQGSFEAIIVGICVFELNQNTLIDLCVIMVFTICASLIGFWHGYIYGIRGNRGIMICSAILLFVSAIILL